ncbi:hypothetical protein Gorai_021342 [Gossypium raimondii]|uniref:Uncharacterized protein n=1 Tax=Gossypium raimondii TaxID=29730 RepID=A0A7J8NQ81_GOSRA|nr:hypothetical protein [Gossypium raimondii]
MSMLVLALVLDLLWSRRKNMQAIPNLHLQTLLIVAANLGISLQGKSFWCNEVTVVSQ